MYNDTYRSLMARMTCLRMIENVEPHVEELTRDKVVVKFTAGAEIARNFEAPVAVLPRRRPPEHPPDRPHSFRR